MRQAMRLVHQPAVGQQVQRRIGRPHLHRAERVAPVRMHRVERRPRGARCRGSAAPARRPRRRCGPCRGGRRSRATCPARARSAPGSPRTGRARRRCGPTGRRAAARPGRRSEPLRPMNSARSPVTEPPTRSRWIDVEEGDPVAEVVAVAVARVERAVVGRDLGVRRAARSSRAGRRAPIRHSRWRESAAAARAVVAQHQARELHRRVERDEYRQLAVRLPPRRARTRCSRSRGG